ncbi:MAG: peptidylprolyl isomerase, FKBP-type [Marmoricola sp.]|nr:peptidylprolyl isomerase, FKBP-type [Marmoricola sp.]
MSALRPRTAAVGAVLVAVVTVVSACSGSVSKADLRSAEGSIVGLAVSGEPGTRPVVRMAPPLKVPTTQTDVLVAGTGAPVQIDQRFVLQLSLYDARTGKAALSTYDAGQVPLVAKDSDDTLFPVLSKALVGQRQGSRLVLALTAADAFGAGGVPPAGIAATDPVVVVADVVAVPPTTVLPGPDGATVAPEPGAPEVQVQDGLPVGISTSGPAPDRLRVVPLVKGTGPKVRSHSLVTLDFLGQQWERVTPFEDTYYKEPAVFPVGTAGSVPAWDAALTGVRRGSRLLVIAPADLSSAPGVPAAPERATIAWVIDVLGVS